MAEVATIQSKQPAEIKPVTVDFSDALSEGEVISDATVDAYQWDDHDQVNEELDLETDYPTADEVVVTLRGAGVELVSVELSLAAALTVLRVTADNENAWTAATGITPIEYVGWDGSTVTFKACGGTAGYRYKIVVTVTTDLGHIFEQDVLMEVEEL